jgi:hypothetical protein
MTYQMRVFYLLNNTNIIQLDIQILIHTLQRSSYLDVVLQLDCNFVIHKGFEETVSVSIVSPCVQPAKAFLARSLE